MPTPEPPRTALDHLAGGVAAPLSDGNVLLLAAAVSLAGPLLLQAPGAVVATAAALVFVLRLRLASGAWWILLVLALVGAGRGALALRGYRARLEAARVALGVPRRCAVDGRVIRSPVVRGGTVRVDLRLDRADCDGRRLRRGTIVRGYGGPPRLARGDRVQAVMQLAPARHFRNFELADPTPGAIRTGLVLSGGILSLEITNRGSGLTSSIDRLRAHVRRRIDATYAPLAAPMGRALVIGENDLPEADDVAFKRSGLAHLLAVSGSHLVLAVVSVTSALTYLLRRLPSLAARVPVERVAALLGAPLALLYADFSGGSGSAWRAAWMLAVAYGARALGRRPRAPRVLAASLLVAVILDPLAVHDISLMLSAAATAGLLAVQAPLARWVARLPGAALRWVAASLGATVASVLPCAPLLAAISPHQTLAGLLANVVAGPVGELAALPACLLHAVASGWPAAEQGLALVGSGALLVVRRVALISAGVEALAFQTPAPTAWHGAAAVFLGVTVVARRWTWVVVGVGALVVAEGLAVRAGRPVGVLRVTALDVGQGDAALVDLPDGALMLVDGGGFVGSPVNPGESVVVPVLRARRRRRVDVVVLSHPHPDHFTGLVPVLEQVAVGELWLTGQGRDEGAGPTYRRLLQVARRRSIAVRTPPELCGRRSFHGAQLAVLAPCPRYVPRRPANDNSLVFRLTLGRRGALLTGDAEAEEEHELLQQHGGGALRADFLKVGHHGSRTSSTLPFLRAVRPAVATMSCGRRNRYGHPHDTTLQRFARLRVEALRLDDVGAVRWETDGETSHTRSFFAPFPWRRSPRSHQLGDDGPHE